MNQWQRDAEYNTMQPREKGYEPLTAAEERKEAAIQALVAYSYKRRIFGHDVIRVDNKVRELIGRMSPIGGA